MTSPAEVRCAECGRRLADGEARAETDGGTFCEICFANLRAQLDRALAVQSEDISYPAALAGGVIGGSVGAAIWWGFTAATNVSFGLVAVVIGFAVGKGILIFTGGRRSIGLQALSAGIAAVAFGYASYLVNRTFILRAYEAQGEALPLPLLPEPDLAFRVISIGFGIMDVVFLAIVLWQAWKMPAPLRLRA